MTSSDLRIGNWVKMISKDKYYFIDRGQDLDNSQDFEPIELTEEILLKCGFVDYDCWLQKEGIQLFNIRNLYYRGNFPIKADIKYLHQLQNLYFALTNEELNVQL